MAHDSRNAQGAGFPLLELFGSYASDHKSVLMYNYALRDFCRFSGISGDSPAAVEQALAGLDTDTALRYKVWSREGITLKDGRRRAAGTTNLRLQIFRRYFRLAQAGGLARTNPFESIRPVRGPMMRPTQAFSTGKAGELIDGCRSLRDRAMIAALIAGALRRSEAAKLTLDDVGEFDGIMFLRLRETKNGKDAIQPIAPWASALVLAYKAARLAAGAAETDPLFISRWGVAIGGEAVYHIVKKACARVGLDPARYGAHSCRATGVTMLLLQGEDRKKVKDFGRFATYEMLDRYDKRARPMSEHAGLKLKI